MPIEDRRAASLAADVEFANAPQTIAMSNAAVVKVDVAKADVAMAVESVTGTASDPGQSWSHGWFAGTLDFDHQEYVAVIYLPRGNGADAARLAQHFFLAMKASTASGAPGSAP